LELLPGVTRPLQACIGESLQEGGGHWMDAGIEVQSGLYQKMHKIIPCPISGIYTSDGLHHPTTSCARLLPAA